MTEQNFKKLLAQMPEDLTEEQRYEIAKKMGIEVGRYGEVGIGPYYTTDLTIFKRKTGNRGKRKQRKMSKSHRKRVDAIKDSIQNPEYYQLIPINITKDYVVMDGGTRITAIQELQNEGFTIKGEPIGVYYNFINDLTIKQIREANRHNPKWSADDMASSWYDLGFEQYAIYLDFKEKYGLPTQETVALLSNNINRHWRKLFNDGDFKVNDIEVAHEFMRYVDLIQEILPSEEGGTHKLTRNRYFLKAMIPCYFSPIFNNQQFLTKLSRQSGSLKRQINAGLMLEIISSIYWQGVPHKNRKKF